MGPLTARVSEWAHVSKWAHLLFVCSLLILIPVLPEGVLAIRENVNLEWFEE